MDNALVKATVALPATVDEVLEEWRQYQELTKKLLDDTDYQSIGQKKFKKKSAWRKYGRAFNLSTKVTYEEIRRADDGFPIWARVRVTAIAPNGREEEADHECHIAERCCPFAIGAACSKGHVHCQTGCNGRTHWSHPGDLPATALTRAKNRAISDLIGAGEVSAEEMEGSKSRTTTSGDAPSETHVIIGGVEAVSKKEGKNKKTGKPWTIYCVRVRGDSFSSFEVKHAEDAKKAKEKGQHVSITWALVNDFKTITTLMIVEPEALGDEIHQPMPTAGIDPEDEAWLTEEAGTEG